MIDISHPHQLAPDAAHAVVQTIAEKLHERFEVSTQWQGETLVFSRPGVDGRIILAPGQQCSLDLAFRPGADEALLSKRAELWFNFSTDALKHPFPVVQVAGTAVPDGGAIFRDGFEP